MDDILYDYHRVEEAIRYLELHAAAQPSLDDVAGHIGLSPWHFQRLFTRWAGVSPKRFLQYITVEAAKKLLEESATLLDTSLEVGLSGPSRLHDLFISTEAVTPGEYKSSGEGLEIRWGIHSSPFGNCLMATSRRGICALEFLDSVDDESARGQPAPDRAAPALAALRLRWPGATFTEDRLSRTQAMRHFTFGATDQSDEPLRLHLKGTNFQLKVWQALLSIPEGALVSYGRLAEMIGAPGSSRAVGTALGQNPVGFLIPCHRVLRSTGAFGGYKWGIERKKALIAYEAAKKRPGL
ncbi:MAG: 6-O-methylguanine DNA methyltransferase [Spirochaetae bacterium HGW-Spirochaetae-9]|nr:MAG: 6-O-methylguanine DNA methyltransferase [Spirochaetae bacterium HGW-Spirochaetae-9]